MSNVSTMRIGEILRAKPSQDVVTISPDAGVRELIALMAKASASATERAAAGPSSPDAPAIRS